MTVFWVFSRICRNKIASDCRLASATFSLSLKRELLASRSGGISEATMRFGKGKTFISTDDEFRLQSPGLFHRLKNCHHVARRHAERVQGGSHLFNGRQFRQRNES